MLEVLQFLFSDVWHWLGTTVWLGMVCTGLAQLRGVVVQILSTGRG